MPLYAGDLAETRAGQRAALSFCDGSTLFVNQSTVAEMTSRQSITMNRGELVERAQGTATHVLEAPAARASIRKGIFDVKLQGNRSTFAVEKGTLLVQNSRGRVQVSADQQTVVAPNRPPPRPAHVDTGSLLTWTAAVTPHVWKVFATFDPSYSPQRLEVNARGDVYVLNLPTSDQSIVELSPSGKQVVSWGLQAANADAYGLALDAQSNVYVTDTANAEIEEFSPNGGFLRTIGSFGHGQPQFLGVHGLEVDSAGNMYVAESSSNQVQKLSPGGKELLLVGGGGSVPGKLNGPEDVAVDKAGDFYVAENTNGRVQKFSPAGKSLATFGSGEMEFPGDIALDAAGNLYVCEPALQHIRELSPAGRTVRLIDGPGPTLGQFDGPTGVALDSAGNLYVADYHNHRILKLTWQ